MFERHQKLILAGLLVLLAAGVVGLLLTSGWAVPALRRIAGRPMRPAQKVLVDQTPLATAENLAALAVTHHERDYAEQALELADQEVDLAFRIALRHAADRAAAPSPELRAIQTRITELEARMQSEQEAIARLAKAVETARVEKKDALQVQLQLAQAGLSLDQDELNDARGDLERAGGDGQAQLQRELEQHEKSRAHTSASAAASAGGGPSSGPGAASWTLIAAYRDWSARRAELTELVQAQQDAAARAGAILQQRDAVVGKIKSARASEQSQPAAASQPASQLPQPALAKLGRAQQDLTDLNKRVEAERKLGELYGNWAALVGNRELRALHALILSATWIVLILLATFLTRYFAVRHFARVAPDRKRLLTARAVTDVFVRAAGVLLILFVVFGPPSQLAAVLALAGAGLTVALKDFIVGFFGWFVLMGRNGVRPGDWVEIKGVQGKVLEVGLLHTVILETGNWTAAGHPTGRKVTFVNSYAIEGHYFNFSTAGQWLWDQIEIGLPASTDPFPVVGAIEKIVRAETENGAKLAEEEWQRWSTASGLPSVPAAPTISVHPTDRGVNIVVRYVTRADERAQLHSRVYGAVFEFFLGKHMLTRDTQTPAETPEVVKP